MFDDPISLLNSALEGRYRIERELGEGGMATVYLADDLKHERKVALKVLKPDLAAIVGAERFLTEIKTTANLQHPNILPLHDSGEADGLLFYVMPYVRGESLRDRLDREVQLPVDDAVGIATDMAEALDYAHRQGVIHRDIKPANLLLQDGKAVISDFGIALAVGVAGGGRLTDTGISVGTPQYMSPEQATGDQSPGPASDIWSAGCVLYEMLVGEPPFTGGTVQAVLGRIVTGEAALVRERRPTVSPGVEASISRALQRVPADRFQTAAEFVAALQGRLHVEPSATTPRRVEARRLTHSGWRRAAPWVLGVALGGGVGWGVGGFLSSSGRDTAAAPVVRFTIPVPQGHLMLSGWPNLDISPTGDALVYVLGDTLFKRRLDAIAPVPLLTRPGVCCPAFSSDGEWVFLGRGGVRPNATGVSVDGGPLVALDNQVAGYLAVHSTATTGGILIHRPGAPQWEQLTVVDTTSNEGAHMWPQLLPDGMSVLYTSLGASLMWDEASIVIQELDSGARHTVLEGGSYGRYLPTGHVVYVDGAGTMQAVPFDLEDLTVTGSPFVIESGIRTAYWAGGASVAVSPTGNLAYVRGSSLRNHRLTWVDRTGAVVGVVGDAHTVEGVRVSPDGRYAATYVASATSDIGIFDLANGELRPLTFAEENEDNPVWSADGSSIAYHLLRSGNDHQIVVRDAFSADDPRVVHRTSGYVAPRSWSPDGNRIVAWEGGALVVINLLDGAVDTVTTRTGAAGGRISPDGRWLAFSSSDTGQEEVYVTSFPSLTGTRPISRNGGRAPDWSIESGELFFLSGDALMVTDVSTGSTFEHSPPRPLFVSKAFADTELWYGVSPDGRRFLYPAANPEAPAREIHVIVNWFEELRRRAQGPG